LELQTILELKQGAYIPKCVSVLRFEEGVWNATEESLECIPKKLVPSVWLYQPGFPIKAVRDQTESKWHCVEIPTGFCIFDVLLARVHENELNCFLVQITRSASPFARHATNMTCSDACKLRIAALLTAARKAINPEADLTCKESFVMLAPNCINGHHTPPPAHTNPYYFVSTYYPTSLSVVKRRKFRQTCAVVFGYKQQGKSQFLYFLAKLLIELGEGVVYLDQTIAPKRGKVVAKVDPKIHPNCCLALWQSNLEAYLLNHDGVSSDSYSVKLRTTVLDALKKFSHDGKPESFSDFCFQLEDLCQFRKLRVWMIVDEATSDDLEMAQFVTKQHLETEVWDLPLFDSGETAKLAKDLQVALGIPNQMLEDALGFNMIQDEQVHWANLGEALDGLFGGEPDYTAEVFLGLQHGLTLDSFLANLYECIVDTFDNILVNSLLKEQLAKNWLTSTNYPYNRWPELRKVVFVDGHLHVGSFLPLF
ncbi:hypothetical protein As57867_001994, partial [Aphanomyces stellatus]